MSVSQTTTTEAMPGFDISAYCDDLGEQFEEEIRSLGVNPSEPTGAKPGSEEKVTMLAARYAAGLPLWHNDDCYDHGPGSIGALLFGGLGAEEPAKAAAIS
jgi:hypothetical protein